MYHNSHAMPSCPTHIENTAKQQNHTRYQTTHGTKPHTVPNHTRYQTTRINETHRRQQPLLPYIFIPPVHYFHLTYTPRTHLYIYTHISTPSPLEQSQNTTIIWHNTCQNSVHGVYINIYIYIYTIRPNQ